MNIVGVDGCSAGWFAVALGAEGSWETGVVPDLSALWNKYRRASLILIDIPIGLKGAGPEERMCDVYARRILGRPRGSSVFRVPCRVAVYKETREEASQANLEETGTGISPFTWGIVPKIREMDRFFETNIEARRIIRESHPELCFWALAGEPMLFKKGISKGFEERYSALQSFPQTEQIVTIALRRYSRTQVKKDDILDALSMAVNALSGPLVSIPGEIERDDRGLPMEMVFRHHQDLLTKNVTFSEVTYG